MPVLDGAASSYPFTYVWSSRTSLGRYCQYIFISLSIAVSIVIYLGVDWAIIYPTDGFTRHMVYRRVSY